MNRETFQTREAMACRGHRPDTPYPGGQDEQTPPAAARKHLSREEMEQLDPIKMQHAAATFVITYLKAAKTGWEGEETEVGGADDRRGIDFHLINRALGADIPVDFSTSSKGGFAVKLLRDWFKVEANGTFVFQPCYAPALFRAFLPAMDPNNKWDLLGWKLAQKA